MTTDPDRPAVPGLEPPDGRPSDGSPVFDPDEHPRLVETSLADDRLEPPRPRRRVLGAADDPDRFDPAADAAAPELPRGLDPALDPDRYRAPGQGQSLTDLLGKSGAMEDERDGMQWAFGLLGVLAFLALVAFLFQNVLTP